jgi:hypothetical protein
MQQPPEEYDLQPRVESAQATSPEQHRMSPAKRLWAAFVSPGEVFGDIRIKPTWVLCLSAMVLLGIAVQFVVVPHIDTEATLRARLGDRADTLSQAQIEDLVEQGEKFARFGPMIGVIVSPLAWAGIAAVFFVLLKMVGSGIDYQRTFSAMLHAYWPPSLVHGALLAALIQRFDRIPQNELPNVVMSHLGAILPADAPAWLSRPASSISVFNIWIVVLLVVGFAKVGEVSKGRAAVAALMPWAVWIVGAAGIASLFS